MNEQPTHIDLFSGIGGFALAAQWAGFKTVAFCEIEPYCQAILKARFCAVMVDATGTPSEAKRVDRLKGLGNAIVPQVAYQILKTIRELI